MNTRRDFVRSLSGLGAIIATGQSPAAIVRSMVGARNAMTSAGGGGSMPTARDYVQDGLVAMWDGVENVGWGIHDNNATTWNDLTGHGRDIRVLNSNAYFSADCLNVSAGSASVQGTAFAVGDIRTIEIGVVYVRGNCIVFFNDVNMLSCSTDRMQFDGRNAENTVVKDGASTFSGVYGVYDGTTLDSACVTSGYADGRPVNLSSWQDWAYAPAKRNMLTIPRYYPFAGGIRFIRVYSRALSAAEIAANHAVDVARFDPQTA